MAGSEHEIEPAKILALREHWAYLLSIAKGMFASGLMPRHVKSQEAAAVIMLMGHDYGFSPMQSIRLINVVDGKPEMAAEAMVAIVRRERAGTFAYESGEGFCKVVGKRHDTGETFTSIWNREDAARAGLDAKDNWRKYEAQMLRHRAEADVCRALFSDLLAATYIPGEIEAGQGPAEQGRRLLSEVPETRTEAIKEALGVVGQEKGEGEDALEAAAETPPEKAREEATADEAAQGAGSGSKGEQENGQGEIEPAGEEEAATGAESAKGKETPAPASAKGKKNAAERGREVAAPEGGRDAEKDEAAVGDFSLVPPGERPMEDEEVVEVYTVVGNDGVPIHTIAKHKLSGELYCDCQGDWQGRCEHVQKAKEMLR